VFELTFWAKIMKVKNYAHYEVTAEYGISHNIKRYTVRTMKGNIIMKVLFVLYSIKMDAASTSTWWTTQEQNWCQLNIVFLLKLLYFPITNLVLIMVRPQHHESARLRVCWYCFLGSLHIFTVSTLEQGTSLHFFP
jgi:hypothetical protein